MFRKSIDLTIFYTCGLFSCIAQASEVEWQRVGKVESFEVFIDRNSIRSNKGMDLHREGDNRKVHVMFSYESKQKNSKGIEFYSETFSDEISCAKRTVTTLSTSLYAAKQGKGKLVYAHQVGVRLPQPILPGTVNEHILKTYVCGA